ncbi:TPA: hypothetical protein ACH3X1_004903 [Trebouxia sp. C0004]
MLRLKVNIKRVLGVPFAHGTADLVRGHPALVKPGREEPLDEPCFGQVVDKDNQQSEEPLSFVRYYAVKPSGKETKNATMRHLVGETVPVSGKQRCRQPSYGVVTVDSITQRACVCPHFALWKQGPAQNFLLNDMLNMWPDLRRIPHDAQQWLLQCSSSQGCSSCNNNGP